MRALPTAVMTRLDAVLDGGDDPVERRDGLLDAIDDPGLELLAQRREARDQAVADRHQLARDGLDLVRDELDGLVDDRVREVLGLVDRGRDRRPDLVEDVGDAVLDLVVERLGLGRDPAEEAAAGGLLLGLLLRLAGVFVALALGVVGFPEAGLDVLGGLGVGAELLALDGGLASADVAGAPPGGRRRPAASARGRVAARLADARLGGGVLGESDRPCPWSPRRRPARGRRPCPGRIWRRAVVSLG